MADEVDEVTEMAQGVASRGQKSGLAHTAAGPDWAKAGALWFNLATLAVVGDEPATLRWQDAGEQDASDSRE
ncbi:hypothetical protein JUNP479_0249 [Aeromonas jandaei]|nr:hypothetical protein JUNP479_0249 [Aeromonas jandaei]